tara:strand:+ start:10000 stop:10425 length:426 start_codon:yes stop_codon:yes gene_type:complete
MTKEEYDALAPYEKRSVGIYNEMKSDDDLRSPKVINYFCPRGKNDPEVTGKEKQIPETNYDKKVDTSLVISKIQDKLFTKKKTKDSRGGKMVRQTLRKDCEKLSPWETYHLSSLMLYARQAHSEGCKMMILSWQEKKFLGI